MFTVIHCITGTEYIVVYVDIQDNKFLCANSFDGSFAKISFSDCRLKLSDNTKGKKIMS